MNTRVITFFIVVSWVQIFFPFSCFSEQINKKSIEPAVPESKIMASGKSESDIENILQSFDDGLDKGAPMILNQDEKKIEKSLLDLKGHFQLGTTYNYAHNPPVEGQIDWRGVSSVRSDLFARIKFKFSNHLRGFLSGKAFYDAAYSINGRSKYSRQILDSCEDELELRQAYIQASLTKIIDVKLGRQIVVWGTSDNIRVTDMINPLDLREPGLTDLEDLRLPVTLSRMDVYFKNFNLTAIAVHEHRFNKNPVFGSDFYLFNMTLPMEKIPENNWRNTDVAMSLNAGFEKFDVSFYLARMFNDKPHMQLLNPLSPGTISMRHARINMAGVTAQVIWGNWLFKSETAFFKGLKFFMRPGNTFSRWDTLLGLEYFGFKNTHIVFEAVNRHINNWEPFFETAPDYTLKNDFQAVLRVSKNFLNATLESSFLGSVFGKDVKNGSFQRYSIKYHFTDSWSIKTGMINYQSGDKFEIKKMGKNDRLFLKVKYSF